MSSLAAIEVARVLLERHGQTFAAELGIQGDRRRRRGHLLPRGPVAWDELVPCADARALRTARQLGLPGDPGGLAGLLSRKDFLRLTAALVRVRRKAERDAVLDAAR